MHYAQSTSFYIKQLIYFFIAVSVFASIQQMRQTTFHSLIKPFYIISLILLLAVFIPGVGVERNGSRSWLDLGLFMLQPAEIVKLTTLLYLSLLLARHKAGISIMRASHFLVICAPVFLIMLQPDFGSAFIIVVASFALLFIANYPMKLFIIVLMLSCGALALLIVAAPYRLQRIEAFLNPWADPLGSGFQAVQAMLAIGPAGIFGHGFLKSRQKYLYLPEPQNDFIFAIILEEIGLLGGIGLLLIFACFLWSAYKLAFQSLQAESFYIISSLTTMLAAQIFLNLGVVVGLLPVTGVTLPFISYGGSSLVLVWLTMAIIIIFTK